MGSGPNENGPPPQWAAPSDRGECITPVKMSISTLTESDAWSDPRERQKPSPAAPQPQEGISIPAFLRPLLGIDFVPYMPKHEIEEETFACEDELLTDEDLVDLDLLGISSSGLASPDDENDLLDQALLSPSSHLISLENDANLDVGSKHYVVETSLEGKAVVSLSKRSKPKRKLSAALSKLVKGRRRADSSSSLKRMLRNRNRSHSRDLPLESSLPTTTRQADSPANNNDGYVIQNHLEWLQEQQCNMAKNQSHLEKVQSEAQCMQHRTLEIHKRVGQVQGEVLQLQKILQASEQRLRLELNDFEAARSELVRLETEAIQASEAVVESIRQMQKSLILRWDVSDTPLTPTGGQLQSGASEPHSTPRRANGHALAANDIPLQLSEATKPLRRRAATAPPLRYSRSESFMRVHDLEIDSRHDSKDGSFHDSSNHETSSISSTSLNNVPASDFLFFDHNITPILNPLSRLGHAVATDETDRFTPTRDTERMLAKYKTMSLEDNTLKDWPIKPWHAVHGNDVLVWTGGVDHTGFGCDWPVCKARGLIQAPPRVLLEYLLDSSKTKEYNKMSQGREDILIIQEGIDVTASDSPYDFSGDCKIIKSLNKPRLLPRTIEMLSLMYSQPLKDAPGAYMTVSRSVFEDDSGEHKCTNQTIRSEMLLGVILIRPADDDHQVSELTTIAHVYSPGVPEMLAKRVAPSSAYNMIRAIQNIFNK